MTALGLLGAETVGRAARIGVELFDPVAMTLIRDGVSVTGGFDHPPRLSLGGRFYWLADHGAWPAALTVDPGATAFAAAVVPLPPEPAAPGDRIVRVTLAPTAAYVPPEGVTAVRGRLRETALPGAAPVAGAAMSLARLDETPAGQTWIDGVIVTASTATGDFTVFTRDRASGTATADPTSRFRVVAQRGAVRRAAPFDLVEGRLLDLTTPLAWADMT